MRILCLVSWTPGGKWLWDYVPDDATAVDFVYIRHPQDRFPGYGKLLGYYERFWWLGLKANATKICARGFSSGISPRAFAVCRDTRHSE